MRVTFLRDAGQHAFGVR